MGKKTILLSGGSGLVGSRLKELIGNIIAPSRSELDITDGNSVPRFVKDFHPNIIIHAAAFTDAAAAENDRELCWKVNVTGTHNIVQATKAIGAFLIFISTGSVFAGNKKNPGPFTEDDEPPAKPEKLTWYGWTKRMAEKEVDGAIIRISHPNYHQKLLRMDPSLGFYTDQRFPITSLDDLAKVIEVLIKTPKPGIYHVASPDLVSPYELMRYVLKKKIKQARIRHVLNQYHALSSKKTQKLLGVRFKSWREAIDEVLPTNSSLG